MNAFLLERIQSSAIENASAWCLNGKLNRWHPPYCQAWNKAAIFKTDLLHHADTHLWFIFLYSSEMVKLLFNPQTKPQFIIEHK